MKNLKKILALILALCSILCVMLLATSCSNTDDPDNNDPGDGDTPGDVVDPNAVAYTLTLLDSDGNGIEGIEVKFIYGSESKNATTNNEGKAVVSLVTDRSVTFELVSHEGYKAPKSSDCRFGMETSVSLTLADADPTYTVKVVDPDGNPIAGVGIQICHGEICRTPRPTDENGVLSASFAPTGSLKVLVANPTQYGLEELPTGEYHFYFEEGSNTLEITLTPVE